jgi:hypothetical protein
MKKIAVVADMQCGHIVGLTPPEFSADKIHRKHAKVRKQCWEFYADQARERGPFDIVIANGDLIEGKGYRSEGVEIMLPDRMEQSKMAIRCLTEIMSPKTDLVMTYGTAYHTGEGEDFENNIADALGAKSIGAIAHLKVEGVTFEVKHHIGSSQVPHTRHTAIARDRLWNILWSERGQLPRADVIIRSHAHYYSYAGGTDWVAMITPALQGYGTRYGARRMSGLVDFGFIVFTVDNGGFSWEPVIANIKAQHAKLLSL